jgi:hypothetical protein
MMTIHNNKQHFFSLALALSIHNKLQLFNMRVSIHESNILMKEWCFVVEYMCLIDMMTSYSTSNKSKTIFEDVYVFTPDVESLTVVGSFVCRLEETKTRTDKKFGVRNSVGGLDIHRNVYGVVILTGKDTHITSSG